MDQTLKKISGLLKHQDPVRRIGAAVVLAEIAPENKDVVKALGEALPDAGQQLSGHILEALQAIGSPAAVPYVMPLLNSQDMAIRMRASAIIACGGSAVVPEIRKQFKESPRQQKLVFIDLLARIHTNETLQMLLDLLFEPDFGLIKETCDAVKRHASGAQPPERLKMHKQVVKFMNTARVKQQERVLTSSLLLLGHIGRPEAAALLLKYTLPKTSPYVRRHALIAMKGVAFAGKTASSVLKKIFPYLEEAEEDIARLTIEIIQRMPEPDISAAQWKKLLQNKHGSARAFAARMLSGMDTADNNALLIELLGHEDNELREVAANALASHKKATPLLLKALASEDNIHITWSLAKILKPHTEAIDKKTVKKFTDLAAKEMLAGKPRYEPLLYFVRNLDPNAAESIMLEAGMAHKKAKRWVNAVDCLRRLLHTQTFNDEVSYALSVCDLKVSKKELSAQYRAEDHALRGFNSLYRHNKEELLTRLKKDKILDTADLYYVGFHFSESAGDERLFGEEILKHVAKTWPKSKEAKDIKARLGR
ncbi:MAG: hypothetical protein A2283_10260 [Lentisphaerae bacterium RIFOXYA12_FULL_48_11]|nr:MAG: hypothetical protein A2283_10260 [Lentisphaerae bacterium RIFOXYA12_FULL_48_11]